MTSTATAYLENDPPDIDEIGLLVERINDLRQKLGLSRPQFAARFGLTHEMIKNWETGRTRPDTLGILLIELILLDPEEVHRMVNRVMAGRGKRRFSLVRTRSASRNHGEDQI